MDNRGVLGGFVTTLTCQTMAVTLIAQITHPRSRAVTKRPIERGVRIPPLHRSAVCGPLRPQTTCWNILGRDHRVHRAPHLHRHGLRVHHQWTRDLDALDPMTFSGIRLWSRFPFRVHQDRGHGLDPKEIAVPHPITDDLDTTTPPLHHRGSGRLDDESLKCCKTWILKMDSLNAHSVGLKPVKWNDMTSP